MKPTNNIYAEEAKNGRARLLPSHPVQIKTARQEPHPTFLILFILLILSKTLLAQTQQAWVAHYNNSIANGTNQALKMVLDTAGNIYVVGSSQNTNANLGYVTIKYAPNGNQLWVARYDSTNYPNATPSSFAIDKSNSVIVTGNALTVKYDQNGNQVWTAPYAGTALAVDSNNYIYVTGFGTNFNTEKLSPVGSNIWQTTYIDSAGPTLPKGIIVDSNSSIYVSGSDQWYDYFVYDYYVQLATIKYDTNGDQIWISTYELGNASSLSICGMALDGIGNIYIESNLGPDLDGYVTFKYASNGNLAWTVIDSDNNGSSMAHGLALDSETNVLITGQTRHEAPLFFATYKLNTNGSILWQNLYPNPQVGVSGANGIAVDPANNVYVTGYSPGTNTGNDIVTIKYNGNGNQAWLQYYNGPGNGNDAGNAMAVDKTGDIYVTGYETTAAGGTEIVTIKYSLVPIQVLTNGGVLLQAQGLSGETFDLQASTNLQTWQDLGTNAADTNGLFQYTDTNAPLYNPRYYVPIPQ